MNNLTQVSNLRQVGWSEFTAIYVFYKLINARKIHFLVIPKTQMTAIWTIQKTPFLYRFADVFHRFWRGRKKSIVRHDWVGKKEIRWAFA